MTWKHSSPSQLKTFLRCNRRWWGQKIGKWPQPPPGPALALGSEVHNHLEQYLLEGTQPPATRAGAIAKQGLHLLPKPPLHPRMVEYSVKLVGAEVPIIGRVDFRDMTGSRPSSREVHRVNDHKTTSGAALSEPELRADMQALVYSLALVRFLNAEQVAFRHVYYHKKRPEAFTQEVLFTAEELEAQWPKLVGLVKQQKNLSTVTDPAKVPHNPSACNDYGGCPFQSQCAKLGVRGNKMSFWNKLAKKTAAPAPEPPMEVNDPTADGELDSLREMLDFVARTEQGWVPSSTTKSKTAKRASLPTPAPLADKLEQTILDLMAMGYGEKKLRAMSIVQLANLSMASTAPVPVSDSEPVGPPDVTVGNGSPSAGSESSSINPPDGTPAGVTVPPPTNTRGSRLPNGTLLSQAKKSDLIEYIGKQIGSTVDAVKASIKRQKWHMSEVRQEAGGIMAGQPSAVRKEIDTAFEAARTEKAKDSQYVSQYVQEMTRQTTSSMLGPARTEKAKAKAPHPLRVPYDASGPAPKPAVPGGRLLVTRQTLYVDCTPGATPTTSLATFVADIVEKVTREPYSANGEPPTVYGHYGALPYGKGKFIIAAILAERLRDGMPLPEALVVDTSVELAGPCLEVLLPRYDVVVRGF